VSKVEEMLHEILRYQKKLASDLTQQNELIQNIENRLNKLETDFPTVVKESEVPTSLIRVLRVLSEDENPISAEETAKKVNLSRNLTSGYLNRLADLGYATKERNLEGKGSRFLFKTNYSGIPQDICQMLKKYEK
jgi:response regulator of citrate/malate metabolism